MTVTEQRREQEYTILRTFRHGRRHRLLCLKDDGYIGRTVELFGEYSESEVDVFRRFVRHDDVVIDAGALFGEHTLALAGLCPDGTVFAFEPQRIAFQMICANAQINSMTNIDAVKCGLGGAEYISRVVGLDPRSPNPWGLTRLSAEVHGTEPIRVRTIDSLFLGRLDFVKLDVEGMEHQVLEGGRQTIRARHPVLYVEFNEDRENILDMLLGLGYPEVWRHHAPVDREPNYRRVPLELARGLDSSPRPSEMVLAVPSNRLPADECEYADWLKANGFWRL